MKKGFIQHTGLDDLHNRVHRMAFFNPETTYITQTVPTVDSLELGESRIYFDGTDYWLYTKLAKTVIGKVQYTVV